MVGLSIAIWCSAVYGIRGFSGWQHFNALDTGCATQMAIWIGFGRYSNKGKIKTLLWLNLLENLKLVYYLQEKTKGSADYV